MSIKKNLLEFMDEYAEDTIKNIGEIKFIAIAAVLSIYVFVGFSVFFMPETADISLKNMTVQIETYTAFELYMVGFVIMISALTIIYMFFGKMKSLHGIGAIGIIVVGTLMLKPEFIGYAVWFCIFSYFISFGWRFNVRKSDARKKY